VFIRYSALLKVSEKTVIKIAEKLQDKYQRRPKLDYFLQAVLGLLYLAEHKTIEQLAEEFGPSVGSTHNYIKLVQEVLAEMLPNHLTDLVGALREHKETVLDGTFLFFANCYNSGFYSGKPRKTGVNVQFLTNLQGEVIWFSPCLPGATHDTKAARIFDIAGAAAEAGAVVFADKGYVGADVDALGQQHNTICFMSRIYRNTDAEVKNMNRQISKVRRVVETPFSRLKNWGILKKCRMNVKGGLHRIDRMLRAVVSLHLLEEKSW